VLDWLREHPAVVDLLRDADMREVSVSDSGQVKSKMEYPL